MTEIIEESAPQSEESPDIAARKAYLRERARERKRKQRRRERMSGTSQPDMVPGSRLEVLENPGPHDEKPEPAQSPPRPIGRPKLWTPEKMQQWQDFICTRIRSGQTLTAICRKHPTGPSIDTVYRWLAESATFATAYDRAKIDAADSFFFQAIDIADSANSEAASVGLARLRSEVRRYAAAKLRPERYAEKTEVQHNGEVKHVISDDQRARALAAFIARQAIGQAQSLPDVRRLIEQKTEKTEPKP